MKLKKELRWTVRVLLAAVTGVLIFVAGGLLVIYTKAPAPPEHMPFDAEIWNDEKRYSAPPYPRQLMVDDLLAKNYFDGKDREAVVSLLGDPPKTGYFRKYDLVYWLGPERSWVSIDSEWLVIKFDSTRHVQEATIATD